MKTAHHHHRIDVKKLQNFYLQAYRLVGFICLMGLITSILWYGFSIIFFSISSRWALPLILSPNQEKVIVHSEHMLNLEHQLAQEQAELKTATKAYRSNVLVLKKFNALQARFKESMRTQSLRDANKSKTLQQLNMEKQSSVSELKRLALESEKKNRMIEDELKLGLITRQEALTEQILLSNLRNYLIDSRASAYALKQQSISLAQASKTLTGVSNDLYALQDVLKKNELDVKRSELKITIYSLQVTMAHLKKDIKKRQKALIKMRKSPYILATKRPTTVAFIPYRHLKHAQVGSHVYSCYFDMLFCYRSGYVAEAYSAEEYGKHPLFKSETKGALIRVVYNNEHDAHKKLVFLKSKPLFF